MNSEERFIDASVSPEDAFLKRVYRDFFDNLWREKLWISAYCFFVVLAGLILTARQTPYYRATSTLLVDSDSAQDPAEQRSLSNLELQSAIIQSPEVIDRVIEKAHLLDDTVFSRSHNPRGVFPGRLAVEPEKLSKTIKIHFMDTRPAVAALIANEVAQAYLDEKASRNTGISTESQGSLKEKLTKEMKNLKSVQTKIAELNKNNPELGNESSVGEQITFLNAEYSRTDVRAIQLRTTLTELESLIQNGESIENHPYFVSNQRVKEKLVAIRSAELEALGQEQEYRGMHPLVLKAKAKVEALKDSLREEKGRVLEELRADLKSAEATLRTIQENLHELQIKEKGLTPQKIEYKELLLEEISIGETIRLLNAQISKASVSSGFKQTGIEILSYATAPRVPFSPNKAKNFFISLFFASFSGLGFIFLRCYFDRTFRTEEDIDLLLMKPFLGHLPLARAPKGSMQPKFRNEKEGAYFANFLRRICANILFLVSDKGSPAIMITGSRPGEGKSFTAYHVAHAFAREGKETILVDVDFCRSGLSAAFQDLKERPGLHDYLTGKAEVEEIIVATGQPNLFYIQSQQAPFSVSYALRSDRMKELVRKLKQDFDVVLFDAQPVLATNDAVAMGELVDLRVLVIEWGKTPKEWVQKALKKIAPSSLVAAAIILNKARHWGSSDYFDHYYDGRKKQEPKRKK